MQKERKQDCPCPSKTCKRHGLCDECRAHHEKNGGLPYCEREKQD